MKLKIKKNLLQSALNDVSKAISSKNIIPILSGIKFETTKDNLILTASDNDITIQTLIETSDDLTIESVGSIIIKGRYILDIIRKLESDYINIEVVDDYKILIYTENSEFSLNGIDSKEYPAIDLELTKDCINVKVKDIKEIINQTYYATSTDEARVVLTGVNLKITDNILECSSTDSYRLALRTLKLDKTLNKEVDLIIPGRNLNELLKILTDTAQEEVELHIFSNKIIFNFGNLLFQSRLINGTYPNTKNLIPNDILFDVRLNKREFFNMIDRASILNSDRDNNVVTLEIDKNKMKVTSMSLETGKAEEKMEISCNDKIKISFSSKYMLDALRTIATEDVVISFVGEIKPILIKEEDKGDLLALILPIRTY